MEKIQNVYDNADFFSEYKSMRDGKINANELIEIPIMKQMLPELEGKTILDLGCGEGGMSQYFAEKGAKKVVGIDVSSNMIASANVQNKYPNVQYLQLAMEELPAITDKFDIVFSSLAFHYIKDFDLLIKNISNLLNPNGILIFSQEHPLTTATIRVDGMAKYTEIDGKRYYFLSDYNNVGKREIYWNIDGVVKYHRNFEVVINAIANAGLMITEVRESKALPEAVKLVEKYKYQKDRPFFAFFKAKKI